MDLRLKRRTLLQSGLMAGCALTLPRQTRAAAGRVLFGFPPGGVGSRVAGVVLSEMRGRYTPDLGSNVVHVVGHSGRRCIDAARHGPADGSTVLACVSSNLTLSPLQAHPAVGSATAGFIAVASLYTYTFGFMVGPAVPAEVTSMRDYLHWVRDDPRRGAYGVPGLGGAPHVLGVSLARSGDAPLKPTAYNSLHTIVREMLQGGVPAAFALPGSLPVNVPPGMIRTLAVTSGQRWAPLPEVPTLRELGLADFDLVGSMGFHLPAGTPDAKVRELAAAVQHALDSPAMAAHLQGGLARSEWETPQAYAAALAQERTNWRVVVNRERFSGG